MRVPLNVVFAIYLVQSVSADLGNIKTPVDYNLATIKEVDVSFSYYKNSGEQFEVFSVGSKATVADTETKFIIHGYGENGHADWLLQIKEAYFRRGSYNVFIVDWSAASGNYEIGASNTKKLGQYIAQFIIDSNIDPAKVQVLGSCLGGQVAGHVGKYYYSVTLKKINRISGLDVAGPKFEDIAVPPENKLQKTDASFVDVTHTNARNWGYKSSIGVVDYYPNGGNIQPGCSNADPLEADTCSHLRAAYFFAESINTPVNAAECTITIDVLGVTIIKLPIGRVLTFGQQVIVPLLGGVFTFTTNAQPPFLTVDVGGIVNIGL